MRMITFAKPGLSIWIALALAAACGKGGKTGGSARDAVLDAWKKGGLDVSAFNATTTSVGKDCATGTVSKLDVLVCAFASSDEATKAADLGYQWVGDTTGSSRASGATVIAVADHHKVDLHGKTVEQLFKLAPK
jgi:hypothetical protein